MKTHPPQLTMHSPRIRLPSSRLRQSPDPPQRLRKILPSPPDNSTPLPLNNLTLHPDDANSKVLAAIARALLSVENRAMTVKDLAEMVPKFGLSCHNPAATLQAITTYTRNHLLRCDVQQDQPLLLRHFLSGTDADDDLFPALYSTSAGSPAPSEKDTGRLTSFRKGTCVWYLSRITGAPCPFTRAGIRLCDYAVTNRDQIPDRKKRKRESRRLAEKAEEDQQCGQKRKRQLRSASISSVDSEHDVSKPPPSIRPKLTLKIKLPSMATVGAVVTVPSTSASPSNVPLCESASISDTGDSSHGSTLCSLPPYPRRSISIPKYRPLIDFQSGSSYPSYYTYRRSPSIPYSVASFPPDSDDDFDDSSDLDAVSVQASSPPRSPSIPCLPIGAGSSGYFFEPKVKEEPTDVQGILDAWEDYDNIRQMEDEVKPFIVDPRLKTEEIGFDTWDRDSVSPLTLPIKQEDIEITTSLYPLHSDASFTNWRSTTPESGPLSPLLSPVSALSPTSPFPDQQSSCFPVSPIAPACGDMMVATRPRSNTVPCLDGFFQSAQPSDPSSSSSPSNLPQSLAELIESLTVGIDTTTQGLVTCISPTQMDIRVCGENEVVLDDSVILSTREPSDPEISFRLLEGVPVFQMKLGCRIVLRRADTGFVSLDPLVSFSDSPRPMSTRSFTVEKGSNLIKGDWLALSDAQAYFKDFPIPSREAYGLHLFLSHSLHERFSPMISAYIRDSNRPDIANGPFGRSFNSMVQAGQIITQAQCSSANAQSPQSAPSQSATRPDTESLDPPLSVTEEEIFHSFLVPMEWEKENLSSASVSSSTPLQNRVANKPLTIITATNACSTDFDIDDEPLTPLSSPTCSVRSVASDPSRAGKPLRRSKRVRDAAAAAAKPKPKTRSRNKC